MPRYHAASVLGLCCLFGMGGTLAAQTMNGFSLRDTAVPREHFRRATPERDTIPALDAPRFVKSDEVKGLAADDEVFTLTINGETRAYPMRVLVCHEIVNDRFGPQSVVVTFAALTDSCLAYDGNETGYGVSGLLYNSCLLLYDRATESLWSQLTGAALAGERLGQILSPIAGRRLTWSAWKDQHPEGRVLWPDTGREEEYLGDWPYGDYGSMREALFPFDINRTDFSTKEPMVGLAIEGRARVWPLKALKGKTEFYDNVGSRQVRVRHHAEAQEVIVEDLYTRELLPATRVYWFAWQAFHPDTSVWEPLN